MDTITLKSMSAALSWSTIHVKWTYKVEQFDRTADVESLMSCFRGKFCMNGQSWKQIPAEQASSVARPLIERPL